MKENRFDACGICKCDHIKEGTCKQISCCDCCEFYTHKETEISFYPGQYVWGGEVRDSRTNSMCARPYFKR